jgi:hypothetical protein
MEGGARSSETLINIHQVLLVLTHVCAGFGRPLDSYQDRVTAITEATGNCTIEANPLLQINNTSSTVHKLFIQKRNIITSFASTE